MKPATNAIPRSWVTTFERKLVGEVRTYWRALTGNDIERENILFWIHTCTGPRAEFLIGRGTKSIQRDLLTKWWGVRDALVNFKHSLSSAQAAQIPPLFRDHSGLMFSLTKTPALHAHFLHLISTSPGDISKLTRGMQLAIDPKVRRLRVPRGDGQSKLMPAVGVLIPLTNKRNGYRNMALLISAAQGAHLSSAKGITEEALRKAVFRNWAAWPMFFPHGAKFRTDA